MSEIDLSRFRGAQSASINSGGGSYDRRIPDNDKDPLRNLLDFNDPMGAIADAAGEVGEQIRNAFVFVIRELTGIDLSSWDAFIASLDDGKGIDLPFLVQGLQTVAAIFGGIDLSSPPTPEEVWAAVMSVFVVPLNLFAALVGGLIPGGLIPGLDASKIVSGLFPISRIGDLQDTLDALQSGIDNIPGGQALIDKICNALGIPGTGHTVTDVYNALFAIPGGNIGSPISAINVPGIDASKIISGTIAQSFLNITNVSASWVTGLLSGANIPVLDQTKVNGLDTIASNASTAQGNWTSWLSGGAWGDIGESVADFLGTKSDAADAQSAARQTITSIYNKLGGNNASTASQAQATAAMQALANTISAQGAAINALQNILEGANGFSASIPFRQPETVVFDAAGAFNYTAPSWFNTTTDFLDVVLCGAGAGGGGGVSDSSGPGGDSLFKANGVTKVTGAGGASVGPGPGGGIGFSPGNQMYLDIFYQGGAGGAINKDGTQPGGGGGGGNFFGVVGNGGNAGAWGTTTLGPGATTAPFTGTVGAGGAGTSTGFSPGDGGDGCVWVKARAAMPASFTSMGTLLLPTYRLNTGVALTDAMTAAATWGRVPPGGSSGGHILIIRANAAFTSYVYLWVKTVSGATNYELGRVSSGVKLAWKTGTVAEAVPFNAFSLTSDDGYIYTIAINGTPFDSYNDAAHSSLMGASYRTGGWASSDSALPGSIIQFAFLDSGTPSVITTNTIATSQGTNSAAYVDLATVGPSVTITVPQSGRVVVDISADMATTAITNQTGFMGIALSGANTIAAADTRCARGTWAGNAGLGGTLSNRFLFEGLTPGTTTFKAMFKSSSGTVNFANRNIIVDPRP